MWLFYLLIYDKILFIYNCYMYRMYYKEYVSLYAICHSMSFLSLARYILHIDVYLYGCFVIMDELMSLF